MYYTDGSGAVGSDFGKHIKGTSILKQQNSDPVPEEKDFRDKPPVFSPEAQSLAFNQNSGGDTEGGFMA